MKKILLGLTSLFVLAMLVCWPHQHPEADIGFLNDRAGDITGATFIRAPGMFTPEGLTGQGEIVALADSGLDKGSVSDIHPDLQSLEGQRPKVVMLKPWADREKADDPSGHGTHMAATIAGTGKASEGQWQGIAPGASVYFQGLLNKQNKLVVPALETLFTPAYEAGARIHVDAWGGGSNTYGDNAKQIDTYVNKYQDFLVVLAAGNNGGQKGTLTAEANSKNALVVGASISPRPALDAENTDGEKAASFSSRGPTKDGRIKPELLAPGTSIVSAKSTVVPGNLTGFPQYISMQGTSMAAAVTGGGAALMRELLRTEMQMYTPSAALVKALLINGARTPHGPSQEGFGILDLTSPAIALKEKTMKLLDEKDGLQTGNAQEYSFMVNTPSNMFKATLVWSDPAPEDASPNTLVNDLDLEIISPSGQRIWGNHFLHTGTADALNTVEQIYIPTPEVGEYVIRVKANYVSSRLSPSGQSFALAYGQLPSTGLVETDGETPGSALFIVDGAVAGGNEPVRQGYREYIVNGRRYIVGRNWHPPGAGYRETNQGTLWYTAKKELRSGGYLQDGQALCMVNGQQTDKIQDIPLGAGVTGVVDPLTQTLQRINVQYAMYTGIVTKVGDANHKTLQLEGISGTFTIADDAAYENNYHIQDSDPFLSAFGPLEMGDYQDIIPGMQVNLVVDSFTQQIQGVTFERNIVVGNIESVLTGSKEILLDNGKKYELSPEASILVDGEMARLGSLQTGQTASIMLAPDSESIALGVAVCSNTAYGQVVFISNADQELYFNDVKSGFHIYKIADKATVIRWGTEDTLASLQGASDIWAMLLLSPQTGEVQGIKVAEKAEQITGELAQLTANQMILKDGREYAASNRASYEKNGYPVMPVDFVKGEPISAITLFDGQGEMVVASLWSEKSFVPESPALQYVALPLTGQYYIAGNTQGEVLYIWRKNHLPVVISPERNGNFSYSFIPEDGEEGVRIVAVNRQTGEVNGKYLTLQPKEENQFKDLEGHWAAEDMLALANQGMLKGYADGTVKPDAPIRREEMAVLLANCFNWKNDVNGKLGAADEEKIASWAKTSVYWCVAMGVMELNVYHNFRPDEALTRGELARLVGNFRRNLGPSLGLQSDTSRENRLLHIVEMDQRSFRLEGILQGDSTKVSDPQKTASRAEAAAALRELLKEIEQSLAPEESMQ